jgi:hypothetical protein
MARKVIFLLIFLISASGCLPFRAVATNAPATTIATYSVCPGTALTTPVTITSFTSIGSFTLRIEYDSTVLSFNQAATTFNPAFNGASINSTPVSGTIKKIMIAWASLTPVTLSDGSSLVTLGFVFQNGSTDLAFNNSSNGGGDCEYTGPSGIPLNDIPTSSYYFNGHVSSSAPPQPPPVTGPVNPCQGASVGYSVTPASGMGYQWTVPTGWNITGGQGTNSITVHVGSTGGTITIVFTNSCGSGPPRTMAVSPILLPTYPGPVNGPEHPCVGVAGALYSINSSTNATGYMWTVPATWIISSGQNTTSINVIPGSSPGIIKAFAFNSCGNSDTATLNVSANQPPVANAGQNQTLGYGSSTTLTGSATGGSGNYSWHWEPSSLLINADIQNPVTVNLTSSVLFTLTVTDQVSSCSGTSQVLITITGGPLSVTATADPNPVCLGRSIQLFALVSGGTGVYTYTWSSVPPGFSSAIQNPVTSPVVSTTYIVSVFDGFATAGDSVMVTVIPLPGIPDRPGGPDSVNLEVVSSSEYTVNSVPGTVSYVWNLTPANAGTITGSDTVAQVSWDQAFIGMAHIKVKTINSCGESPWSEEKLTLVDRTTSVETSADGGQMLIFPNPCEGSFKIRIESDYTETSEILVLDYTGKVVASTGYFIMPSIFEKDLNLGTNAKGIYLVLLKSSRGNILRKLVVN